ncbi:ABC transporter ATP-binding protein [Peptococcaceae bacterium 1198_IL3148]
MTIVLNSLYKNYINGDEVTEVLKDVSLQIQDGDFLAIIGPSGSGKSTLMNIIGCLDRPSSGSYKLDGNDISKLDDNALAEIRNQHIGFIFQSFNLLPQYTALENVELAIQYSKSNKNARQQAIQALDALGLSNRLKHKPNQLSGGQKQRVAIARALVNSPSLLLADEPTGNLDSKTGQEVLEIFQELNSRGKTIIIVTHDLDIAHRAKRVISIKDGVLEEVTN